MVDKPLRPPNLAVGFRSTRQLRAVRDAIRQQDRPLSVDELLQLVSKQLPKTGVATIYRLIKRLVEEKEVVAVALAGQPPRYESAGKAHHHHFLCRICDRAYDIAGCRQTFARGVPAGFEVEQHEVLLKGRCRSCPALQAKR